MLFPDLGFLERVLLLSVVLAALALLDVWRRGRRATRPREYALLVACGVSGALAGVGVDAVTSAVSPEYFEFVKRIPRGPGFGWRVAALGAEAGFSAGVVAAGVVLVARGRRGEERAARPEALSSLFPRLAGVLGVALVVGVVVASVAHLCGAPILVPAPRDAAMDERARGLVAVVWWAHVGVYAGLVGGVVSMVVGLRRRARGGGGGGGSVAPPGG